MSKAKPIILISLFPALFAVIFMVYVFMPAYSDLKKVENKIEAKQQQIDSANRKISEAKANQKLEKEIIELENMLGDFSISVPEKEELAMFLIDLDKFAQKSEVKVIEVTRRKECVIAIKDPNSKAEEPTLRSKIKSKKKKRRRKNNEPELPVKLYEIPMDIQVLGYYTDVKKFIDHLETYQRKLLIEGIFAKDYEKDCKTLNPRVRTTIYTKIFRSIEQEVQEEEKAVKSNKYLKNKKG